ncbi:caspase family protein [Pelomyxa schiedti]|nr:caspase family protein [Pelomyxa schiedti]
MCRQLTLAAFMAAPNNLCREKKWETTKAREGRRPDRGARSRRRYGCRQRTVAASASPHVLPRGGDFDFAIAVVAPGDQATYDCARSAISSKHPLSPPPRPSSSAPSLPTTTTTTTIPLVVTVVSVDSDGHGCVIDPGCVTQAGFCPVTVVDLMSAQTHALLMYGPLSRLAAVTPDPAGLDSMHPLELSSRGYVTMPGSSDLHRGVPAWFIAFLTRALRRALPPGKQGAAVVQYLTPTRRGTDEKGDLPHIGTVLGSNGAPLPRDSVNFEELGLAWIPALDKEAILVSDTYFQYEKVRDMFLDIVEAFYVSLALGLKDGKGAILQSPASLNVTTPGTTPPLETPKPANLPPKPPASNQPLVSSTQMPTEFQSETIPTNPLPASVQTAPDSPTPLSPKPKGTTPVDLTSKSDNIVTHSSTNTEAEAFSANALHVSSTMTSQLPAFSLSTANVDQVCLWLGSVGIDDDCLKVIRSNKLRGRTLANYTVQQLCSLGIVVGDAEIIVEEVRSHLASQQQRRPRCSVSSHRSMLIKDLQAQVETLQQQLNAGSPTLFSPELNYKCFAFVIGNESYGQSTLKNAVSDAETISLFLRTTCKFEVVCHVNISNIQDFASKLEQFKATLKEQQKARNKVASIFYFAGHGRQIKGHNFLLMTSDETAFTETNFDVIKYKAPMLGIVLDEIKKHSDLTIGILDACRESDHDDRDEFRTRGFSSTRSSSMTKEDFPAGCIVIYPTSPGKTTLDACKLPNHKNNGFFTGCFLEVAEKAHPGTPFGDIVDDTILMVQSLSNGEQSPWLSKSVGARFALF